MMMMIITEVVEDQTVQETETRTEIAREDSALMAKVQEDPIQVRAVEDRTVEIPAIVQEVEILIQDVEIQETQAEVQIQVQGDRGLHRWVKKREQELHEWEVRHPEAEEVQIAEETEMEDQTMQILEAAQEVETPVQDVEIREIQEEAQTQVPEDRVLPHWVKKKEQELQEWEVSLLTVVEEIQTRDQENQDLEEEKIRNFLKLALSKQKSQF